jgi:hypothetical protein
MARMHGEHPSDYGRRKLWEQQSAMATAEFEQQQRQAVFVLPACPCCFLPYPHCVPLEHALMQARHESAEWRRWGAARR